MSIDNPYEAPPPQGPYDGQPRQRSGWLTTFAVISIILGAMGLLGALGGLVAGGLSLAGVKYSSAFEGAQSPQEKAQYEYQKAIEEMSAKYVPIQLVVNVANLAVSIGLLLGGIWCLGQKMSGRKLLMISSFVALALIIITTILEIYVSVEMTAAIGKFAGKLAGPGMNASDMEAILRMTMIGSIIFSVFITAIKAIFYLCCGIYLSKNASMFQPATSV